MFSKKFLYLHEDSSNKRGFNKAKTEYEATIKVLN